MRETRQVEVSKFGLDVYCKGANVWLHVNQDGEVTILSCTNLKVKFSAGPYAEVATVAFQKVDLFAHSRDFTKEPVHHQDMLRLEAVAYHQDEEAQEFRNAYIGGSQALTNFHVKYRRSEHAAGYGTRY